MHISQKCQYALRAVFELAKHYGRGPVKTVEIAEAQAIPARFLEGILNQLRQGRFVESRRGNAGGYLLAHAPHTVTVGEVIRFVEGPVGPVACVEKGARTHCPLIGDCVFLGLWERVQKAVSEVYDSTTLQELVVKERRMRSEYVPTYVI